MIDAISCVVHKASASRLAAALRNPCAEQCGSPASLHCSRNQFPKPAAVNDLPNCVVRNVR